MKHDRFKLSLKSIKLSKFSDDPKNLLLFNEMINFMIRKFETRNDEKEKNSISYPKRQGKLHVYPLIRDPLVRNARGWKEIVAQLN